MRGDGLGAAHAGGGPGDLHGIEINPLAAELARTTIWIGDIQWRIRNGIYARPEPILRKLDSIECRDALISLNDDLHVQARWPSADFIVGNPPFLGGQLLRSRLGDEYVGNLFKVYADCVPQGADLVTYWFEKARACLESHPDVRVGFVATQSIRRGDSRVLVDRVQHATGIFEAWSDEEWTIDGADVRVSLICFGKSNTLKHRNGTIVARINSDLSSSVADLTTLLENLDICFQGPVKVGRLRYPRRTC